MLLSVHESRYKSSRKVRAVGPYGRIPLCSEAAFILLKVGEGTPELASMLDVTSVATQWHKVCKFTSSLALHVCRRFLLCKLKSIGSSSLRCDCRQVQETSSTHDQQHCC